MLRRFVSLLALSALLLQGVAAWAQPQMTPHSSTSVEQADEGAEHCQGSKTAAPKPAAKPSCCSGDCGASCAQACGGAATALPNLPMELEDFISEHYSTLQSEPGLSPAHKFSTLRPPATPES